MLMQFQAAASPKNCPSIAQKVDSTTTISYQLAGSNKTGTIPRAEDSFVEFIKTADAGGNSCTAIDFHSAVLFLDEPTGIKVGDYELKPSEATGLKRVAKFTAVGSKKQLAANCKYLKADVKTEMECIDGSELQYSITFEVWKTGAYRVTITGTQKDAVVYASSKPAPPQ